MAEGGVDTTRGLAILQSLVQTGKISESQYSKLVLSIG